MFLRKQYIVWFCIGLYSTACASSQMYVLPRIAHPVAQQIEIEEKNYKDRQLKRFAVKIGTSTAVLLAIYATYNASRYFKELDRRMSRVDQRIADVEKTVDPSMLKTVASVQIPASNNSEKFVKNESSFNPVSWLAGGVKSGVSGTKNIVTDIGKCIIQSFPTFISGMAISTLWEQICRRIVEASKQESLFWYLEQQTELWPLLQDITVNCIPYDVQAELLSLQQVHDKSTDQMNAYVEDLAELKAGKSDGFIGSDYFDYSSGELKNAYMKKGSELARLQNYAVSNIAKRKRAVEQGLSGAMLFEDGVVGKKNIADLCTMLTGQIQKVLAFVEMHMQKRHAELSTATIERGRIRINQVIMTTNKYVERVEQLLNLDDERLNSMSIANQGLFTVTYEFERLLREHFVVLHRYCMLIK